MTTPITTLVPVFVFLALLLVIGFLANRGIKDSRDYEKDYFIANRSLGGVVLAMTLVATYGSVSSFVSGPGVAWNLGFGWVAFAAPQIITGFLLLGIVGKKLAVIARRLDALTVIDILRARFESPTIATLLGLVTLVFFTAMCVGQFMGGARIFAAITGLDYKLGLVLFAAVTVIYTSSGFRAVVWTDAVCAVLMLIGMAALGSTVLKTGGGLDGIMATLSTVNIGADGTSNNFKPDAGGALPYSLLFSSWFLVGFCTIGLPQSLVRCLSYRHTSDLSRAMVVATVICGALMIGMTLLGVLARGVVLEKPADGTDAVIPLLIVNHMDPLLAGITIIGPLAATMSTVSSLLIAAASTLIRDLWEGRRGTEKEKRKSADNRSHRLLNVSVTLVLGLVSILLALYPQSIVVWVNLFAFGGLESAFLWPVLLGLFWPRFNACGALCGIIAGLGLYTLATVAGWHFMGFHNIVIGSITGLVFSVIGSFFGKPVPQRIMAVFFPHKL